MAARSHSERDCERSHRSIHLPRGRQPRRTRTPVHLSPEVLALAERLDSGCHRNEICAGLGIDPRALEVPRGSVDECGERCSCPDRTELAEVAERHHLVVDGTDPGDGETDWIALIGGDDGRDLWLRRGQQHAVDVVANVEAA